MITGCDINLLGSTNLSRFHAVASEGIWKWGIIGKETGKARRAEA